MIAIAPPATHYRSACSSPTLTPFLSIPRNFLIASTLQTKHMLTSCQTKAAGKPQPPVLFPGTVTAALQCETLPPLRHYTDYFHSGGHARTERERKGST